MPGASHHWLMKSEPSAFSIEDLARAPGRTTSWDGVRNYQSRNYMRQMKLGDRVLFYHSSTEPRALVGIAEVVRDAYPDHTAFDQKDKHFDPKSNPAKPTWDMVDIRLVRKLSRPLSLDSLRKQPGLTKMELLRRGSRLSVQPVRPQEWKLILALAEE